MRVECMRSALMAALACFAWPALGATSYHYMFGQPSYVVTRGDTVDVSVYLQETGATALMETGLVGAGTTVRFDESPEPSSPSAILTAANVVAGPGFTEVWGVDAQPDLGYANLSLGAGDNVVYGVETPSGSGTYRVLLGTFTFTAGTIANEVTHIIATDYDAGFDDTILADMNFTVLDDHILDGIATITVVPEPASLVLTATMFWGLLAILWRGKRRRKGVVARQ